MDLAMLAVGAAVVVLFFAALGLRARRDRAGAAPPPAQEPDAGRRTAAPPLTSLYDDSEGGVAEGTTKIDRAALESIIGAPSGAVAHAYFLVIAGEGLGRLIKLDRDAFIIGRDPARADICFRDDAISSQHARVSLRNGRVELEDLGSSNGTFVDGEPVQRAVLHDGARVVLGRSTVLTLTFQDALGEKFQRQMWESSTRDGLTKAYNKATFLDLLASEMHFANRHKTNFCLAVIDIDHFKRVNDTYGHLVGDEILASFAELIRRVIRTEAMFARYGGEEFIVAERSATAKDGEMFAERIRSTTEAHGFATTAGVLKITTSIGIADLHSTGSTSGTELLEAADAALYRAKQGGRNRIVVANRPPATR